MPLGIVSLACTLFLGLEAGKDYVLIQGNWWVVFGSTESPDRNCYIDRWTAWVRDKTLVLQEITPDADIERHVTIFVLDPTANPKRIDLLDATASGRKVVMRGIYEVTPHMLVLYLYGRGAGGQRPKDFAIPEQAKFDYMLLILRRVKEL
jgi:uncharacterized protein (TIGR03067 family)